MSEDGNSRPMAGVDFPFDYITGYYLRFRNMIPFAEFISGKVGPPAPMGYYALIEIELPNPDVEPNQRIITLPIKNKSDFKSLYCAQIDKGIKDGSNELIVLYEHRKNIFGGIKPSLHVAAYPAGTWNGFYEAVSQYASDRFKWPNALFLYQPSELKAFPASNNIFSI